jgi:hypothetical protein
LHRGLSLSLPLLLQLCVSSAASVLAPFGDFVHSAALPTGRSSEMAGRDQDRVSDESVAAQLLNASRSIAQPPLLAPNSPGEGDAQPI